LLFILEETLYWELVPSKRNCKYKALTLTQVLSRNWYCGKDVVNYYLINTGLFIIALEFKGLRCHVALEKL
jgi:hypothetical protein